MSAFAFDSNLPSLPVPDLRDTSRMVRRLAQPVNPPPVWEKTCRAAEALPDQGLPLQQALLDYERSLGGNESWLRPLWDDAYLSFRDALPMNLNYSLELYPQFWGGAQALPRLIRGICGALWRVGRQDLPPERVKSGCISMDTLRSMAYTRIPCPCRDVLMPVSLSGPVRIAASCRGHWFLLTISDAAGNLAPENEIARAIGEIRAEASKLPPALPVGAMTAAPRETAAEIRATLQKDLRNRLSLDALEQSVFALCLDPPQGEGPDLVHALLCGDSGNRWFDKSLQVIAAENGGLGVNCEHAGCDGSLWAYLLGQAGAIMPEEHPSVPVSFRRLEWRVSDSLAGRLSDARESHAERSGKLSVACYAAETVTRGAVKVMGCTPDVFAQLAIQTAYYCLTGRFPSVYEAVSVRRFFQGRTECARSSTQEALDFARAIRGETHHSESIRALLRQADHAHRERLAVCQNALGAERHLYGLSMMYQMFGAELGMSCPPDLFSDPGWRAVCHNTLSTSSINAPHIGFFGFGPVVEDGLGISYALRNGDFILAATSLPGSGITAREYVQAVGETLTKMSALLTGEADAGNR